MLLSALVAGARAAVGSTYNIAAPLYRRIIDTFTAGELDEACRLQGLSATMVRTIARWPFHSAMKEIVKIIGPDCGPCRLPQPRLTEEQADELRRNLERIEFFNWGRGIAP